jgi:DNA helicase-2/ATP-dependent DNA helicase PcrA
MPITPEQIQSAQEVQHDAGRDTADRVRLVAGPGTGKSSTIEERVRWLLEQGAEAKSIVAVSFTRASAFDLRGRVHGYCLTNGYPDGAEVGISTLHSLALRTLRRAGALEAYPADPLVLDEWELSNIFEAEFGHEAGVGSIVRRREIRRDHEAFWSTGMYDPPHQVPPDPPITDEERHRFSRFHRPRSQTYSCVLPGEIVRKCVELMEAGTLDPASLLDVDHLIVDEFQDLNPMDLKFVHGMAESGATLFVAGDDDQSLYSFRFASPSGIQRFGETFPDAGDHALEACFRCTPAVLAVGRSLIEANPMDQRIPKDQVSLYGEADPPLEGHTHFWRFSSGAEEARAIAESCGQLIAEGLPPRSILILLSNQRAQGRDLFNALESANVPFEPPRAEPFRDTQAGRLVFGALRIVCEPQDYVAHRTLLGIQRGVGVSTCSEIARAVVAENLNYRNLFYESLPANVFAGRAEKALQGVQAVVGQVATWGEADTLDARSEDLSELLADVLDEESVDAWNEYADELPGAMTIDELRQLLMIDKEAQQAELIEDVFRRIGESPPDDIFPAKVQVMSMHGAKGLSARVVMVPGLEEDILPGPRRRPYPGLVLEAARMLYVSITRARLACFVSFASRRFVNGRTRAQTASRFTADLGTGFQSRSAGLTQEAAAQIVTEAEAL